MRVQIPQLVEQVSFDSPNWLGHHPFKVGVRVQAPYRTQNIPFKPASAGSFLPIHFRNKRLNKCRNAAAGGFRRQNAMIKAIHFGRIMAITQTDIDNLNAAIASGTRSVTIGGQTITYGTVDALIRARNDLQKLLNAEAGARTRSRQTYAYHAGRSY